MSRRIGLAVGSIALASAAFASNADAQTSPPDTPTPAAVSEPHAGLWGRGEPRLFLATTIDGGYLYIKPRVTFGYGKPFWRWVGLDVNPIATTNYLGVYGGLRFAIPHADLRVGSRYINSLAHDYLEQRGGYDAIDLNTTTNNGRAHYYTLEAELSAAVPAGPGSILTVLTLAGIRGAPTDRYVYEEHVRVIASTSYWRARLGYGLRLGKEGNATAGVVGEVIGLPGRSASVFRAGFIAAFGFSEHLEAVLSIVPPLKGPDTIGIAGGDIAEFGLRYRAATGTHPGLRDEDERFTGRRGGREEELSSAGRGTNAQDANCHGEVLAGIV